MHMGIKASLRGIVLTVSFILFALVVSTCGGKAVGRPPGCPPQAGEGRRDGGVQAPALQKETTLDEALAELDSLLTPEGVDAGVFAQLKSALAEELSKTRPSTRDFSPAGEARLKPSVLQEGRKLVSTPPTGPSNRVDDLALIDNGNGTYTLTWTYRNCGDYNQDGVVDVKDVVPLAAHFNEPADETNEWIDGNADGAITILDVTPLAAGFFNEVAGYIIEGAPSEFSEFSEVDRAPFVYEEGLSARKGFEYILSEEDVGDNFWFRVLPYDSEGKVGEASDAARRPFIPGNPPEIGSIGEVAGDSGSAQVFTAQVSGDTPISYRMDFAGGAEPTEITGVIESYEGDYAEIAANITLCRGGDLPEPTKVYPAKLTLTNASGEVSSDIALSVTAIWHIEEIPKVPGYEDEELAGAEYFFGPDGSLWGEQGYLTAPDVPNVFLVRMLNGEIIEYEEAKRSEGESSGNFAVDRENNPARLFGKEVGFMSDDYYFARRINGNWQEELFLKAQDAGAGLEWVSIFFDSVNRPVIVYSRRLGPATGDLWMASGAGEEWSFEQVGDTGSPLQYLSTVLGGDDVLHVSFTADRTLYYSDDGDGTWTTRVVKQSFSDEQGHNHWFLGLDLALDDNGTPWILFADMVYNAEFKYELSVVTLDPAGDEEEFLYAYETDAGLPEGQDLFTFVNGMPLITFRDPVEMVQKVAWQDVGRWHVRAASPNLFNGQLKVAPGGTWAIVADSVLGAYR